MKNLVKKGATSRIEYIWVSDSASAVGAGKTGLAYNTGSLTAYYARRGAAATSITLATQTVTGAFSSGGFVEVDGTNMPGLYRFDPPDAAFATGVDKVIILLKGAAGMAPVVMEFQLVDFDPESAASLGLTNLDATVSSRATQTSVDDIPTNAELATALGTADDAVLTAIDALPTNAELATALAAADDAVLAAIAGLPTAPDATTIADAFLDRDMGAGADTQTRSPRNALRFIRNGFSIAGTTLTVLKEDDTTAAYTRDLATDASADPIVGVS